MYAHEYMYSLAVLYYALAVPQTSLWVATAGRALGVFYLRYSFNTHNTAIIGTVKTFIECRMYTGVLLGACAYISTAKKYVLNR